MLEKNVLWCLVLGVIAFAGYEQYGDPTTTQKEPQVEQQVATPEVESWWDTSVSCPNSERPHYCERLH